MSKYVENSDKVRKSVFSLSLIYFNFTPASGIRNPDGGYPLDIRPPDCEFQAQLFTCGFISKPTSSLNHSLTPSSGSLTRDSNALSMVLIARSSGLFA